MTKLTHAQAQKILNDQGFVFEKINEFKVRYKYPKNRTNTIYFNQGKIEFLINRGKYDICFKSISPSELKLLIFLCILKGNDRKEFQDNFNFEKLEQKIQDLKSEKSTLKENLFSKRNNKLSRIIEKFDDIIFKE